jgi:hypothetical protein
VLHLVSLRDQKSSLFLASIVPSCTESSGVEVQVNGVQIADTQRPTLLFETRLPTRYYIPLDMRMDLLVRPTPSPAARTRASPNTGPSMPAARRSRLGLVIQDAAPRERQDRRGWSRSTTSGPVSSWTANARCGQRLSYRNASLLTGAR